MVDTLHQLNLTISTEEDRLLLRLSTSGRSEYRLWLTRRFVRALWDVLVKAAERQPGVGDQGNEEVRKAIYLETQKLTQEYLPFTYLVNQLSLGAVRNTIDGVQYSALGGSLWNIHELTLTQE